MDAENSRKKIYCRLCLCSCNVSFDLNYGTPSVKQKMDVCFPDLDLLLVENPRICLDCFVSLTHTYLLLIRYSYSQKIITSYLSSTNSKKPFSLQDMMKGKQFSRQDFKHEATILRLKDQIESVMMNMIEMELKNVDCDETSMDEAVNTLLLKKDLADSDAAEIDEVNYNTLQQLQSENLPAIEATCSNSSSFNNDVTLESIEASISNSSSFANDVTVESVLEADADVLKEEVDEFDEQEDVKVKVEDLNMDYFNSEELDEVEVNQSKFSCDECEMEFSTNLGLIKHSKSHKAECSICGKVLRDKYSLKVHLRSHVKEKLFVCEKCGKGFKQSRSRTRHMLVCAVDCKVEDV